MSTQREITKTELKAHNKPDDLWCAISGKVYDLTKFKAEHPGGDDVLIDSAGKDATRDFIEVGHSKEAEDMMKQYCIGVLAKDDQPCGSKCIFLSAGAVLAGIVTAIIIKRIISGSK